MIANKTINKFDDVDFGELSSSSNEENENDEIDYNDDDDDDNNNNNTNDTKSKAKIKNKRKPKQIIFNVSDTKYSVVKYVGKKLLKWKLSFENDSEWDIYWTDSAVQPDMLAKMKSFQKINHFPGMYSLARKNHLGRNLMRMRKIFPSSYNFFPQTWLLPVDFSDFKQQFKNGKKKTFIIKPEASCQGRGIFLTKTWENIRSTDHYVAQRYLSKPYLIDGLKFDMRIYVLVAGCDPMKIFLYKEGLARFATEEYHPPNGQNIEEVCMHLTNYAINKDNPNFIFNEDANVDDLGHKRSITSVFKLLESKGYDINKLWEDIQKIIIKTLCSVQPILSSYYKSCQMDDPYNNMCFEILGFDIMLDHKLKPWLIEVNHTPSFTTDTPLDKNIKKNVIYDTLVLMNISYKNKVNYKNKKKQELQQRILTGKKLIKTNNERLAEFEQAQKERDAWESKNHGGFVKIYPFDNDKEPSEPYDEFLKECDKWWKEWTGIDDITPQFLAIKKNLKTALEDKDQKLGRSLQKSSVNCNSDQKPKPITHYSRTMKNILKKPSNLATTMASNLMVNPTTGTMKNIMSNHVSRSINQSPIENSFDNMHFVINNSNVDYISASIIRDKIPNDIYQEEEEIIETNSIDDYDIHKGQSFNKRRSPNRFLFSIPKKIAILIVAHDQLLIEKELFAEAGYEIDKSKKDINSNLNNEINLLKTQTSEQSASKKKLDNVWLPERAKKYVKSPQKGQQIIQTTLEERNSQKEVTPNRLSLHYLNDHNKTNGNGFIVASDISSYFSGNNRMLGKLNTIQDKSIEKKGQSITQPKAQNNLEKLFSNYGMANILQPSISQQQQQQQQYHQRSNPKINNLPRVHNNNNKNDDWLSITNDGTNPIRHAIIGRKSSSWKSLPFPGPVLEISRGDHNKVRNTEHNTNYHYLSATMDLNNMDYQDNNGIRNKSFLVENTIQPKNSFQQSVVQDIKSMKTGENKYDCIERHYPKTNQQEQQQQHHQFQYQQQKQDLQQYQPPTQQQQPQLIEKLIQSKMMMCGALSSSSFSSSNMTFNTNINDKYGKLNHNLNYRKSILPSTSIPTQALNHQNNSISLKLLQETLLAGKKAYMLKNMNNYQY